jgi:hypothetical protein
MKLRPFPGMKRMFPLRLPSQVIRFEREPISLLTVAGWHSWPDVEEALTCFGFATAKCSGSIVPDHMTGDEIKSPHC